MDKKQLKNGTFIELEHSKSLAKFLRPGVRIIDVAKAIAKDHLQEDKNYYKKLKLIEPLADKKSLTVQKAVEPYDSRGKTVFNLRNLPGVYLIYKSGQLRYVGFSGTDVYKTLYRHLQSWNDKTQHRTVYKNLAGITVRVVYTRNGTTARRLENALILKHRPADNENKYDGYVTDEQEKAVLKEFENAPIVGIYQYKGDLPF